MKIATDPSPSHPMRPAVPTPLNSPIAPPIIPNTSNAAPAAARLRPVVALVSPPSRIAAIGETRPAVRAGTTADTRVTPTPSATARTIVRVARIVGESGRLAPSAPNSASSPADRPIPTTMPMAEASTPTRRASPMIDRRI